MITELVIGSKAIQLLNNNLDVPKKEWVKERPKIIARPIMI